MRDYLRSRHLCLITEDLARAKRDIAAIFGVQVAYVDPDVDVFQIENVLFTFGLSLMEIAQPTAPTAATRRFLDSTGGRGGYVIAFHCSDPVQRAARANALGIRTTADLDYSHGNFHAFQLHPKDCHGVMLEFDHTTGGEHLLGPLYAAGGAGWVNSVDTSQTVGITEVVMQVPAPPETADVWSTLLDLPVENDGGRLRIDMDLFAIAFEQAPDGAKPAFTAIGVKVKDRTAAIDRARSLGYPVSDDTIELCGVTFRLS